MTEAVKVEEVSKYFTAVKAVDKLSMQVAMGEIMGLVGPDGAGKTTLMRIMTGIYGDYTGKVTVLGCADKLEKIKAQIGYMPQQFSLYQNMTLLENLQFIAALYNLEKSDAEAKISYMLQFTGLWPFKERLAGKLSGGMKQKLALAAAVLHKPQVLFLDEPTTGVDPVARREFWQLLYTLNKEGMTVIVATPYMDEAALCHRILFLQQGRKLICQTPQHIIDTYPYTVLQVASKERSLPRLLSGCYLLDMEFFSDTYHIITDQPDRTTSEIRNRLNTYYEMIPEIKIITPSLEDAFILLAEKGASSWQQ